MELPPNVVAKTAAVQSAHTMLLVTAARSTITVPEQRRTGLEPAASVCMPATAAAPAAIVAKTVSPALDTRSTEASKITRSAHAIMIHT